MNTEQTTILKEDQILQKIKRMAYEIYERNTKEQKLIVVGVFKQGYHLAELLIAELSEISPIKTELVRMEIDKQDPINSPIKLDIEEEHLRDAAVVLVDDVLNTGKTMTYCLKPFMSKNIKKLEIAVLVNRSHKQFPISANYQGYELATTINEHIEVVLGPKRKYAYLR